MVHAVAIARVFLVEDDDARVALGVFFDDVERMIGGAVVDTDDFEVFEGLGEEAV